MGLLSQSSNDISNELSAILRIIRTYYRNDIKLQITNTNPIKEFKLKIIRNFGYYKFLFLINIPKDYPHKPLSAEPIIASKEMMTHFYSQDFKCFKLRMLIDELVSFCHKYDSYNLKTLQISFPATRMYGEKEITTKVFIVFNKALSTYKNRIEFETNGNKTPKSLVKYSVIHNNDYYNDMGISMLNYVNMLNNLSLKNENKIAVAKDYFPSSMVKENSLSKTKINLSLSKEIKRHLAKTLYNRTKKTFSKTIYKIQANEVKFSKFNLMKAKIVLDPCIALANNLSKADLIEEIFVLVEDTSGMNFNIFENVLSIEQEKLNEFKNLVKYSPTTLVYQTNSMKFIPNGYINNLAVVAIGSREIIPAKYLYISTNDMIEAMVFMKNLKTRKFVKILMNDLKFLNITERFVGFIEDIFHFFETDINLISNSLTINFPYKILKIEYLSDSQSIQQSLLKDRIAQRMLLNGYYCQSKIQNDINKIPIRNKLTQLYADTISEVIHFPKTGIKNFEYTLRLNPRSSRHRNLIDNIGLLKFKHYSQLEIIAPTDYNLKIFFIKEIFNPNGTGVVIKLHKLAQENILYQLIVEENNYLKKLSETNKSIWCSEIISNSNLDFIKLILSLGKMYLEKIQWKKQMRLEAQFLNCSELQIQRYYFSKEMVESLSIFTKNI